MYCFLFAFCSLLWLATAVPPTERAPQVDHDPTEPTTTDGSEAYCATCALEWFEYGLCRGEHQYLYLLKCTQPEGCRECGSETQGSTTTQAPSACRGFLMCPWKWPWE